MLNQKVLLLKMRMGPSSSTKSQITEAEMANHTGKAFESHLLLRLSNWVLFENMWNIGDPHTQAGW